ncbi:EF-P lysine aminoacylase EpmA [Pseudohongiella spirulinae]|uniref:PoxB regulator PoxA n=1 Tax=Pseudohongiella spirulinae TaxID=1249552 RepID=A0A0S2K9Z3_9GAMM|nr:EF-P lysine aminoacylase EpmA [Pseudohongiella spirulinae]ALO45080.1 poxB regulator PoxA [Pseudohongiella spirulinae]
MKADWQPAAPLDNLRQRAAMLACVRQFFAERGVLEVETPLLCQSSGTDIHLDSIAVELNPGAIRYLQTSPEFAMKRLLAAGSGPIYQLCKAFRRDECGSRHNPEFSMLEWYRPGFDEQDLMQEVEALLRSCLSVDRLPLHNFRRSSYRQLFQQHLSVDPFKVADNELIALARQKTASPSLHLNRDEALNLLMAAVIEPQLLQPVFVTDFPASQAALAQIRRDSDGTLLARRFELFVNGMEIANGYLELTDADEQARRFQADNEVRRQTGLPVYPPDTRLLAALNAGLPDCAGVALGFDRLLMLALDAIQIDQVISFTAGNA